METIFSKILYFQDLHINFDSRVISVIYIFSNYKFLGLNKKDDKEDTENKERNDRNKERIQRLTKIFKTTPLVLFERY